MSAVRVHREVSGPSDAPVLVLADSLGSTLAMWEPQVADLAHHRRVVRYDLRGHGGSPAPDGPYTIADLGGDLLALLDDLEVDRADLCGLSLGGMVSMWVAAHAPDRVRGLVVCATSAQLVPETWAARARTVLDEGMGAVVDRVVGVWFTPAYAAEHPELVDRMRAMIASSSPIGYAACCRAIESMDLTGDLASIVAPTLVLVGAEDTATPVEHSERIAAGIEGARLVVVPDAAHLVNVQQPAVVAGSILDHLDRMEGPS
jgi:3-oxoadipate enol-lactonase